ncbi:hypothetical protein BDZ94DRAFT_1308862 [Collybia nuda]|uniref:Nephrocystin 3-like N-terminal domain-containing protein n=1 Tax=Collybia nuda TaxID=64659 RepID=A0A9P6CII7_9AGAR|nr:hypothetical protein BDZ94DRAFT_1308862 [Collybia nuda]
MCHPLITRWLHSNDVESYDEPRLWLHGGPGTGKSVLAAYLMDKKKEVRSQDEIVLCAFCGVQGGIQSTSGSIALGFLRQCLEEYYESFEKHDFDILYRIIWDARDGRLYTLDQLRAPLFSLFKCFKKICFIIDGIDECEADVFERRGIINILFNENSVPSSFLLSGRREAAVVKHLKDFPQVEIGGSETTEGDIQMFVSAEVDRLASEYPECKASKDLLKEGLFRGAGSMFLWVKLKLDVIRSIDSDSGDILEDNVETSIKATVNHVLGALVDWRKADDGVPYAALVHYSLREYLLSNGLPTQYPSQISPERLFRTCCAILRSSAVRKPLKQYYDSADKRRRSGGVGESVNWRTLSRRGDVERKKRIVFGENCEFRDIAPPQFIKNQEDYLKLLRKMRDDEREDARKLIATPGLLERELMMYALKVNKMDSTSPCPGTMSTTANIDLSTTLQPIEEAIGIIQQLACGEKPNYYMHIFNMNFWRGIPVIHPENIWTNQSARLLKGAKQLVASTHMLELATLAIKNLRDTELTFHALEDRGTVVPGSSFLVHTLRHTGHTFALWIMAHIYTSSDQKSETVKALQGDSFLHPSLLHSIKVTTHIEPQNTTILRFEFDAWNYYLIALSLVLFFSFIVGSLLFVY